MDSMTAGSLTGRGVRARLLHMRQGLRSSGALQGPRLGPPLWTAAPGQPVECNVYPNATDCIRRRLSEQSVVRGRTGER